MFYCDCVNNMEDFVVVFLYDRLSYKVIFGYMF